MLTHIFFAICVLLFGAAMAILCGKKDLKVGDQKKIIRILVVVLVFALAGIFTYEPMPSPNTAEMYPSPAVSEN